MYVATRLLAWSRSSISVRAMMVGLREVRLWVLGLGRFGHREMVGLWFLVDGSCDEVWFWPASRRRNEPVTGNVRWLYRDNYENALD